jgi:hypothetical protein
VPKSLVEKIAEACAGLDTILKEGENSDEGYAYLRILDLTRQVRAKFFAAGLVIIPSVTDCRVESVPAEESTPNRWYTTATVCCTYIVTDGVQSHTGMTAGYARDLDAKCVAIAQTGALKTFLKGLCLIFGEYDDPEIPERAPWKKKDQIAEEWKDVSAKNAEVLAEIEAKRAKKES